MSDEVSVQWRWVEELTETVELFQDCLAAHPAGADLEDWRKRLERAAWRLQVRPVRELGDRFREAVYEGAQKLGKTVSCEAMDAEIEIPLRLHESLGRILIHAARNAVDHGLESANERAVVGKPPVGMVRLEYGLRDAALCLRITDDGRGPEWPRILKKALDRGLLAGRSLSEVSIEQRLELLFEPGFSSRNEAGALSGRGVGLDALRSGVSEYGGTVTARIPQGGQGFELEISVPLDGIALNVLPIQIGSKEIWIPASEVQDILVDGVPPEGTGYLATLLGESMPDSPAWLKWRSGIPMPPAAVDQVGLPEFRLFRRVGEMWSTVTDASVARVLALMEATGQGAAGVLASKSATGLAPIFDLGQLVRLHARAVGAPENLVKLELQPHRQPVV